MANEGELIRTEVTPNGTVVEYRRNAQGGEDVNVRVPMISSQSVTHPFPGTAKVPKEPEK